MEVRQMNKQEALDWIMGEAFANREVITITEVPDGVVAAVTVTTIGEISDAEKLNLQHEIGDAILRKVNENHGEDKVDPLADIPAKIVKECHGSILDEMRDKASKHIKEQQRELDHRLSNLMHIMNDAKVQMMAGPIPPAEEECDRETACREKPTCRNCKFVLYEPDTDEYFCQRYPPVLGANNCELIINVVPNGWCGEHA